MDLGAPGLGTHALEVDNVAGTSLRLGKHSVPWEPRLSASVRSTVTLLIAEGSIECVCHWVCGCTGSLGKI